MAEELKIYQEGLRSESKTQILLLVDHVQNRRLLADHLSRSFEVVEPETNGIPDISFDLCIVDVSSLRELRSELNSRKEAQKPTFLPYLLLSETKTFDGLPDDLSTLIDEVVGVPISKTELDARIENLLHRRWLSLELTRRKERSEERFKSLFETTPDPVVVVTNDGTISETNRAFEQVFGLDEESIRGQQITDLQFSPVEAVERLLVRLDDFTRGGPENGTVQWKNDTNDSLVMEVNTEILTGLEDAAERIGIFRDVTERTKHTQELERQNERLEEFAHTIAHDLRNPLNVAKGYMEMAHETGDLEHLDQAIPAHERMEQLIDEILTLAREGQAVLDPTNLSIVEVAEQAWSHVETPEATLETPGDRSTTIQADEGRLCELFENLFRNAVEHGRSDVTIRVGLLEDRNGFFVEDDGPGIPEEDRSEVFEAGYTDSRDGTGFGLAIVQQIIEGHNWAITVTEAATGGARFEIYEVW